MTSTALTETGFNVDTKWTTARVPTWFKVETNTWEFYWIEYLLAGGLFLCCAGAALYVAFQAVRTRNSQHMNFFAIIEGICSVCGCCAGCSTFVFLILACMGYQAMTSPATLCAETAGLTVAGGVQTATPTPAQLADCIALTTKLQTPMMLQILFLVWSFICVCCFCFPISAASSKFSLDTMRIFDAEAGYGQSMY